MQRFKNILVIYRNDVGDEATLARAAELAKRNRARLTVAEVVDEGDLSSRVAAAGLEGARLFVEQRRLHLDRLIASLHLDGIESRATVLKGNPFLEITREVVRQRHDLVMMTAEGPQGLRKMFFGSTSLHLMRKCPCPVWITQGSPDHYSGILAAIDPSSPSDDKDLLNRTILQLASSLARVEHGKLHVAHAWDFSGNDLDTSRSEITQEILDGLIRKNEETHRARVDALLADCDLRDLPVEIHLPRGRPEWVIPELARDRGIELIVMGTVSRSGLPGIFIGNTAETVLQQVDSAVLTVKPPGFVSPVTDQSGIPIQAAQADAVEK